MKSSWSYTGSEDGPSLKVTGTVGPGLLRTGTLPHSGRRPGTLLESQSAFSWGPGPITTVIMTLPRTQPPDSKHADSDTGAGPLTAAAEGRPPGDRA